MEELSEREAEVLELVARHLSNPQIAEQLYISVRTVESHVASLIRKLGVPDRRTLVAYAAEANRSATGGPDLRARTNLPLSRSSFVGRKAECEQLHQMVLSDALVTLSGIGGCGKTRLALEVASNVEGDFEDGVFFVDLSAVSDPTLVAQAVASALTLQMLDPTPEALADYFAERQTLLLLDNCEHLLDACAAVADVLLGRCPRLRIVATSREPLGLDGERVFRVPSLGIAEEAVALFVERARGARPDLRIDSRSQATIAEICRRLDGVPLAIELAATRAAHLSPVDILERLNDRFRLLVGGRRRIQRQQTLSAALDWSYDLLDPDEQRLLRRLAVFRGSFSLSAAEAICHPKAMELLGSLAAKSLLSVIDDDERLRYRLLESVRIYAEGKLVETGESDPLRSAHRDWCLERIESLDIDQMSHLFISSTMLVEEDNVTAALEWCRQQGRYDLCARIAVRMAVYWYAYSRLSEMMAWWRELDAGLPAEDRDHRAMAFLLRSMAAWLARDWDEVNLYSARACALADPHSWVGAVAQYRQAVHWAMIDPPRGDRLFEQVLETFASIGRPPPPGLYLTFCLSRLLGAAGRDEALAFLVDLLPALRDSTPGPSWAAAFALYGDTQTALELMSRTEPAGSPINRYLYEFSEAVLASAQGQFDDAEQHLATLTSVVLDHAIPFGEAGCLIGFAKVALDRGDYDRSSRLLATVKSTVGPGARPRGSLLDALVYAQCTRVLADVLDPETESTTHAEGANLSVREALDAELTRSGRAAAQ